MVSMEPIVREYGRAARTVRAMHIGRQVLGGNLPPCLFPYGGALRTTVRNAIVRPLPGCAPSLREDALASYPLVSATPSE